MPNEQLSLEFQTGDERKKKLRDSILRKRQTNEPFTTEEKELIHEQAEEDVKDRNNSYPH